MRQPASSVNGFVAMAVTQLKRAVLVLPLVLGACGVAPGAVVVPTIETETPFPAVPPVRVYESVLAKRSNPGLAAGVASRPATTPRLHLPLVLHFEPRVAKLEYFVRETMEGARAWNDALGTTVFVRGDASTPGQLISVDSTEGLETKPGSLTIVGEVDNPAQPTWMHFWLGFMGQDNLAQQTAVLHEEGHLLGLAHSDIPKDVMYSENGFSRGLTARDIVRARAVLAALARH